jgi:hypothetical protein
MEKLSSTDAGWRQVLLKKLALLLSIVYVITSSACQPRKEAGFAIYLLAENIPATELAQIDIKQLSLEAKPIISNDDIITYDKTDHMIALIPAAYARVRQISPMPVNGNPFVVCVGNEHIYTGAFWTPISSLSFDGVVIMQPLDAKDTTIQISLGYPGADFFTGKDPRADSRVMRALEKDKKLK